ncbi:hypothetical protein TcasGA2_TC031830, partial [Tribolium castaneum]
VTKNVPCMCNDNGRTMENTTIEKLEITQFDGKDYDHWKFRMEIILDHHDVKRCIEEENATPDDAFLKMDKKCKSLIIQCIANSHLQYVKDKTTAYQMWISLEAGFQRKGITSQLFLRKKLLTMKLSSNDTMEKHFLKFEETIRELKSVGAKLEEMDVVCHLLLTFPKSFDPLVTALETMEPSKLTLDFVKGKLLNYELKRKNQCSEIEVPGSSAFNSRKFNKQQSVWNKNVFPFMCHNCGKKGHKRADCHLLKQANQISSEHVAFVSYSGNAQDETVCGKMKWYVDSGATDYMVNSKEHLTNVRIGNPRSPARAQAASSERALPWDGPHLIARTRGIHMKKVNLKQEKEAGKLAGEGTLRKDLSKTDALKVAAGKQTAKLDEAENPKTQGEDSSLENINPFDMQAMQDDVFEEIFKWQRHIQMEDSDDDVVLVESPENKGVGIQVATQTKEVVTKNAETQTPLEMWGKSTQVTEMSQPGQLREPLYIGDKRSFVDFKDLSKRDWKESYFEKVKIKAVNPLAMMPEAAPTIIRSRDKKEEGALLKMLHQRCPEYRESVLEGENPIESKVTPIVRSVVVGHVAGPKETLKNYMFVVVGDEKNKASGYLKETYEALEEFKEVLKELQIEKVAIGSDLTGREEHLRKMLEYIFRGENVEVTLCVPIAKEMIWRDQGKAQSAISASPKGMRKTDAVIVQGSKTETYEAVLKEVHESLAETDCEIRAVRKTREVKEALCSKMANRKIVLRDGSTKEDKVLHVKGLDALAVETEIVSSVVAAMDGTITNTDLEVTSLRKAYGGSKGKKEPHFFSFPQREPRKQESPRKPSNQEVRKPRSKYRGASPKTAPTSVLLATTTTTAATAVTVTVTPANNTTTVNTATPTSTATNVATAAPPP